MISAIMITAETSPTFDVACSRLESGNYVQGSGSDDHFIWLSLTSGGCAGIHQIAKLAELKRRGLLSVIDGIEGDSFGGIGAAIVAGDHIEEASEYIFKLGEKWFINPWRALLIGKQAVSSDVLRRTLEPVLDTERITTSPIPVNIGVSCLKPLKAMSVDLSKVEPDQVIPWVMRGAHLPIASGAANRDENGIPYADPGLTSHGPMRRARLNGATDIIHISCNPLGIEKKKLREVALAGIWALRHDPRAIAKINATMDEQVELRQPHREGHFVCEGANVVGFYLPNPDKEKDEKPLAKLWTTDPGRLKYSFERATEYMKNCLDILMPEFKPATV